MGNDVRRLKIFPAKIFACAKLYFFSDSNMAATAEDRNRSLKQALVESLTAILSPDQQARQMAEEQLKVLEVTEGKDIYLLWIPWSCAKSIENVLHAAYGDLAHFMKLTSWFWVPSLARGNLLDLLQKLTEWPYLAAHLTLFDCWLGFVHDRDKSWA